MLKGLPISPGYALGKAYFIRQSQLKSVPSYSIQEEALQHEVSRYLTALRISRTEIQNLLELPNMKSSPEIANIFQAHLTLLDDPDLKREVEKRIMDRKLNAEAVIAAVVHDFSEFFRKLPDPQFQGKAIDIIDVGQRILKNCESETVMTPLTDLQDGVIIIAENLTPSEIVDLNPEMIRGIAIAEGTPNSHASILARSLGIPALIQVKDLLGNVSRGDLLTVDGVNGFLEVNPSNDRIQKFKGALAVHEAKMQAQKETLAQPSVTLDGVRITTMANIGKLQDVDTVLRNLADGIGLYRTEFAYLTQRRFPTEDELLESYSSVIERLGDREVVFRTIDLGGEKIPHLVGTTIEKNPELGWRAVRMALDRPEILKTQLKAILRATSLFPKSRVKILFPMISNLPEFRKCRLIFHEVVEELLKSGHQVPDWIPLGVMVEIPSTALMARRFAAEADFLSIGSNDLIQYTLAVDRTNSKVAHLYQPTNPAVLRLIREVAKAGEDSGKPVSICGEIAGDQRFTFMLLGLGLRILSMNAGALPTIKQAVRGISCRDAAAIVLPLVECCTAEEVEEALQKSNPLANNH